MSESILSAAASGRGRPGPALSILRAGLHRVSRDWRGPALERGVWHADAAEC